MTPPTSTAEPFAGYRGDAVLLAAPTPARSTRWSATALVAIFCNLLAGAAVQHDPEAWPGTPTTPTILPRLDGPATRGCGGGANWK